MRILLVSLCSNPLSELEFVRPIKQILSHHGIKSLIRHYIEATLEDAELSEKIIICGAALKDAAFLENLSSLAWLRETDKPILGIGSGSQAVMKIFNGKLIDKAKIGVFKVKVNRKNKLTDKKVFYAYFLTKKIARIVSPIVALAKAGALPCMVKHELREVYGCFFHPEVMNPEIILNFTLKTN